MRVHRIGKFLPLTLGTLGVVLKGRVESSGSVPASGSDADGSSADHGCAIERVGIHSVVEDEAGRNWFLACSCGE